MTSPAVAFARIGQPLAESLMSDTVRVERTGDLTTDQATGAVDEHTTFLYEGKARIRPETTSESDTQTAGEARDLLDQFRVAIPFSVPDVHTNDTVVVVASIDPSMVGARMRVIGVVRGTAVSARRLRCRLDSVT